MCHVVVSEIESGNIDTVTGYNVCVCTVSHLGVTTTTLNVTLVVHYVTLRCDDHYTECYTGCTLCHTYVCSHASVSYTTSSH